MKKRFSDEQIISILREAEVSARSSVVSTPFPMPLSTPGARSLVAWKFLR
jgi:hypothetical protein